MNRFILTAAAPILLWALPAATFAAPQAEPTPKPGPPDKPSVATGRDAMQKMEKAVAPYVLRAKKTYGQAKARFLKGLPKGQQFFVTYALKENEGRSQEQVFITVKSIKAGKITGAISNKLDRVVTFKRGQVITFPEAEILDWTITHPDGTEEGNSVGRFLDTYKP